MRQLAERASILFGTLSEEERAAAIAQRRAPVLKTLAELFVEGLDVYKVPGSRSQAEAWDQGDAPPPLA